MAKDPASIYLPGRRGLAWLKLKKAYATLDVVVVGVEWGHGKRRHVLSDYTFAVRDERTGELLPVGKAYSGLTDAEIAHYTEHFLAHTLEEHGHYRTVEPDVVLEVGFDTIQPSTAPRLRLRAALPPHSAHPRRQAGERDRYARVLPQAGGSRAAGQIDSVRKG
ncbi:MAG: hypothetical protein WDO13_12255 [Verrucomicrobiota bacterium]